MLRIGPNNSRPCTQRKKTVRGDSSTVFPTSGWSLRWSFLTSTFILAFIAGSFASSVLAQPPTGDPTPYKAAIDDIDFLVGEWRGSGWISSGPNVRETFDSWEKVEKRLDGSALLIEGRHTDTDASENDPPSHHALATVVWSEKDQSYRFLSALYNRDGGNFKGWVDDSGAFVWEISEPNRLVRFVIQLDENGHWDENGNVSLDGGGTWFPFFHMNLERIKP